ADINFIDTAGNVFLQQEPGLHLYVEGKKLQTPAKEAPTRLFQPSGLTLLFGLLVTPESVNRSYRDLAKANGVALGTVGWIMRDLREQGYVEPLGKDRIQLIRKKELLDRWVDGYATRLRPKILAGEFVLDPTKDFDSVMDGFENYAFEQNMQWGLTGGFGAFELLHHYRGMTLSIFIEKWSSYTALAALHLLPHEGGDVKVLQSFSPQVFGKTARQTGHPVVHPLLVYAELLFQGGDRELEAGRHLYTTFLEESLAKD
ncbi:MAG: type IV toxin-antitoxin system AbiEi family antitoxin, partial [Nitrospirales bacterium]